MDEEKKSNLIWNSCEDNPPEKDGIYLLCYNDNNWLCWDRAYYKKQDNVWIDPGTDCIYGFKDDYYDCPCIPYMWAEIKLPIN